MNSKPLSQQLEEAFVRCRDMDASLAERLQAFADAVRQFGPHFQDAVDHLVERLKQHDVGESAPKPGETMPNFVLPDETGQLVSLDALLEKGPVAVTFHRGHWCPYCRINTRVLAEAQGQIAAEGGQVAAIMPDREHFTAGLKAESEAPFPILTDFDNGYALSLNLAFWVGEEMQELISFDEIAVGGDGSSERSGCPGGVQRGSARGHASGAALRAVRGWLQMALDDRGVRP